MTIKREQDPTELDDPIADAAVTSVGRELGIPPLVDDLDDAALRAHWDRLAQHPAPPTSDLWIERAYQRLRRSAVDEEALVRDRDGMLARLPPR